MSRNRRTLTVDYLRQILDYDADTGVFRWTAPRRKIRVGDRAGTLQPIGYRRIVVDGRAHREHRLAWLYVHGAWPTFEVDHRNGDKADNRLANLREATRAENNQNSHGLSRNNSSGFRGVSRYKVPGRWVADISTNGRRRRLGVFDSPEEASAAYVAAKRELHPFWSAA